MLVRQEMQVFLEMSGLLHQASTLAHFMLITATVLDI
jgi:hypothetical protein